MPEIDPVSGARIVFEPLVEKLCNRQVPSRAQATPLGQQAQDALRSDARLAIVEQAAVAVSLGTDHGLGHVIASYPLGGLLAVMSFLAMSLTRQGRWAAPRR